MSNTMTSNNGGRQQHLLPSTTLDLCRRMIADRLSIERHAKNPSAEVLGVLSAAMATIEAIEAEAAILAHLNRFLVRSGADIL